MIISFYTLAFITFLSTTVLHGAESSAAAVREETIQTAFEKGEIDRILMNRYRKNLLALPADSSALVAWQDHDTQKTLSQTKLLAYLLATRGHFNFVNNRVPYGRGFLTNLDMRIPSSLEMIKHIDILVALPEYLISNGQITKNKHYSAHVVEQLYCKLYAEYTMVLSKPAEYTDNQVRFLHELLVQGNLIHGQYQQEACLDCDKQIRFLDFYEEPHA